jgi:hypothetical protein
VHSAEVAIYELALLQPPPPTDSPSLYQQPVFDPKRIEYLTACLNTCKAARDHFLAGDIASITASSMLIFPYCIKVLYKLSTVINIPGWDLAIVKATVDIVQCLEQAADVAERANAKFKEETGDDSVFALAAETLRATAPSWRVPSSDANEVVGDLAAAVGWNCGISGDVSLLDFSDDFWLSGTLNF